MGFADLAESVEAKGGAGEGEGEWDDGDAVLEEGTVPQGSRTGGNRRRGGVQGRAHEGQPEGGTRGGRGVPPEGGAANRSRWSCSRRSGRNDRRLNDTNAREVRRRRRDGWRRAASTRKSARVAAHFLDGQSHCRFPLFQACSASQTPAVTSARRPSIPSPDMSLLAISSSAVPGARAVASRRASRRVAPRRAIAAPVRASDGGVEAATDGEVPRRRDGGAG